MVVKLEVSCNYVPGRRQEYLEWLKKIVPILTAPEELKKMTAWVNRQAGSPHRVVDFVFDDAQALEKWLGREEVKKVVDEWHDISSNHDAKVLELSYEKAR